MQYRSFVLKFSHVAVGPMRERKEKKNDNGMDFAHYFDGALNNIDIIYLFIYQWRFKDFFFFFFEKKIKR